MAKVKCPSCQAAVEVVGAPGSVVECDECGKKFKLAARKPAPAAASAASRKPAPPDDDDDEPVAKPKKKKLKKRRSSGGGTPIWVLPVVGVTVLAAVALGVVFVVAPLFKRMIGFDVMMAIADDVDSVAVVIPKNVTGASGISAMAEQMKGGGSHYAPTPPEGFGLEPGHLTKAIAVKKGLKKFHIVYSDFRPRAERKATLAHRGVSIWEDKPKHLEAPRYVVAGRNDLALFPTKEDAALGIDRMLDGKKAGYCPEVKWAAYFTRAPGDMREIFSLGKGSEIVKPKTVYVELSYKDDDYAVTYTLDYGAPDAAAAGKSSIDRCWEKVREIIKEFWTKNPTAEGNPFERVDWLMNRDIVADGGKLVYRLKFTGVSSGPSMPLIREAFSMGDAPWGGVEEVMKGLRK